MAKQLTPPTKTALISNTDLEGHLDFRDPADSDNVVIDDMKFTLYIKCDDGSRGTAMVKISDYLSGQTLTDFRAALIILRDACFTEAGYIDV